jgi:hypothetical protein
VLTGAASRETLTSNLAALGVEWSSETDEALASLTERSDDYWGTRSRLAWN